MPKKAKSKLDIYVGSVDDASSEIPFEKRKKQAEEPMYLKRM